jgi:glycosyltransferase involved in cell wall biosynthesis
MHDVGRVSAITGLGYVFINPAIKARLLRPLVRSLMRFALGGERARVILQNRDDVAFFGAARLVADDQIRLIEGSGVDCARFASRAPATTVGPQTSFRVLLVGRMLWDKGVRELVEAARSLKAEGRDIEFVLAGGGDPGNPASIPEDELRGWQAEGLVTWLGHVDEGMPGLLHSADVVVLPSYREGLPKTLIEAAACGKPLITTDVPGCREVVQDQVDGLLIPVRDAPALARGIARLQDDPILAMRLGQAARSKALERFDERIILSKTLSVYVEISSGGHFP